MRGGGWAPPHAQQGGAGKSLAGVSGARHPVIERERLLARIESSPADVVAIIAGPGYGKSTLLASLARRDPRPVIWLSLDVRDDDPTIMLSDLAFAIDRSHAIEPALLERLTTSPAAQLVARVRELSRHIMSLGVPGLVVIDDVHLVTNPLALDIVHSLIGQRPEGWTIALASRTEPDISLPRLRAAGRLLKLGDIDLAMDESETTQFVQGLMPSLGEESISLIWRRTEGWPVAIYLATLSIRDRADPDRAASRFGGDDRLITDYVRDELLRKLSSRDLRFMMRTSILEDLEPALCDAVTRTTGSARFLERLSRTNPLVSPLVDQPGCYRYHQLFREVLLAELTSNEPGMLPELRGRAMRWSEAHGRMDDAVHFAQSSGDTHEAARIVSSLVRTYIGTGRLETVGRMLAWFDDDASSVYPPLALSQGFYHLFAGDVDPVRWLRIAETSGFEGPMADGSGPFQAGVAVLRAALCIDGPDQMAADLVLASPLGEPTNDWRVFHHILAAEAALALHQTDRARAILDRVVEFAGPTHNTGHLMALSQLAAIAVEEGQWDEASRQIGRAQHLRRSLGLGENMLAPLMFAVSALILAHQGAPDLAARELVEAQKLRILSSVAIPLIVIRSRVTMARAYLSLSDVGGARTVLAEARGCSRTDRT